MSDIEPDPEFPVINTAKKRASLRVLGRPRKKINLRMGGLQTTFKIRPLIVEGLAMAFNLSGPFMSQHGMDQLHSKKTLKIQGKEVPLVPSKELGGRLAHAYPVESLAYVATTTTVPAQSAIFVPLRVPDVERGQRPAGQVMVEAQAHFINHTDVHPVMGAISHVNTHGLTWASVLNTLEHDITLKEGLRYGQITDWKEDPPRIASMSLGAQQAERSDEWYEDQFRLKESPVLQDPEDRKRAVSLLREFGELFSDNDEYGRTNLLEHEIHTTEGPPVKCRHRPLNPNLEANLKEQVQHWEKQDVIEPSTSPWSFPLLAVPKKNGKIRWCCDFRLLNDRTIKDAFPLPHIEDNLARLSKSTIFSGIDGTGAYHVVSIREKDREKTAFSTPWGLYQFKQMPFGLCNAPATYCRLVQKVLEGIPLSVAIPYLDDTCVHSVDLEGHLRGLRQVLQAHADAGLTLQPAKCQLFRTEIEYLGHQISPQGIAVPPKYVQVVQDWPEPTSVKDVRVFIGKVSYYRRFIPGFSAIAAPLTDLIKQEKNAPEEPFEFTSAGQEAFRKLKAQLSQAPILAYPQFDSDQPFILDTDWSHDPGAIGAVLSQVQDGEERVIAYGARKLNHAEANYSSHKGELLAVIYFLRLWKYYLSHRRFILRTDHEALKWIRRMEEPKGMILRWIETLAHYDFEVQFRAGKKHANADALSRAEHAQLLDTSDLLDEEILDGFAALMADRTSQGNDLLMEQQQDDELRHVRRWIETGSWPTAKEAKEFGTQLRAYYALGPELLKLDEEGLIVRVGEPSFHHREVRICIPQGKRNELMTKIHEEHGHRGHINTYEQFARRFYCPGMAAEAKIVTQTCENCQRNRAAPNAQKHTLMSTLTGSPFSRWSIDFVGPLPVSDQGHSYILTAKDCFTRWVEAFPTSDMTAHTVARILEKEIFCRYGIPEHIHSDQGSQFTSERMRAIYDELGIHATTTPAYNPKSNPVERTHRDLGRLLRASIDEHPDDWENYLPDCLLAMRIARNRSTGFSPFFMVYGQECVMPIDFIYGNAPSQPVSHTAHAQQIRQRMEAVHKAARENQQMAIERSRQAYRNRLKDGPLEENDRVWLFTPKTTARSRKLQIRWTGPWQVMKVVSPVLFTISSGPWNANRIELTVSLDRLKRYYGRGEVLEQTLNLTREDVDIADEHVELAEELPPQREPEMPEDDPGAGSAPVGAAAPPRDPGPGPEPSNIFRSDSPEWGKDLTSDTLPSAPPMPEAMDTPSTPRSPWENPFRPDKTMHTREETMDQNFEALPQVQTSTPQPALQGGEFFGFQEADIVASRERQRRLLPITRDATNPLELQYEGMDEDSHNWIVAKRERTLADDEELIDDSFGPLPSTMRVPRPIRRTQSALTGPRDHHGQELAIKGDSLTETPASPLPRLQLAPPPRRLALPAPAPAILPRPPAAPPATEGPRPTSRAKRPPGTPASTLPDSKRFHPGTPRPT